LKVISPNPLRDDAASFDGSTEEAQIPGLARADGRSVWRQGVRPNSRSPLVPPAVRAVIESIEVDARAKGWPPELLWNAEFWGSPRGLAALLDEGDAIVEVATDYIAILKVERNILRFQRRAS
jgi:hypothetical protein